jgi:hypothetical protein
VVEFVESLLDSDAEIAANTGRTIAVNKLKDGGVLARAAVSWPSRSVSAS